MNKDPLLTGKPGRIDRVDIPAMAFLSIEGQGAPGGDAHATAVSALYTLAYGARFAGKAQGHDEKVSVLEGLWWADDMAAFTAGDRAQWRWRMMIRAPGWLDPAALDGLRAAAVAKKAKQAALVAALGHVTLDRFTEGLCLQALHIGPYADEGPLIARMHAEAAVQGLALTGHHHEIYLADPSRTAPEKLKTLLRQPVRPA